MGQASLQAPVGNECSSGTWILLARSAQIKENTAHGKGYNDTKTADIQESPEGWAGESTSRRCSSI